MKINYTKRGVMKFIYLRRAYLWVAELTKTLIVFWVKNPMETPAILWFIFSKLIVSPKYLLRNVFVEKRGLEFRNFIDETVAIYNKIGNSFNPYSPSSYAKVEPYLQNKFQIYYFVVRKVKPKIVLETGVATGESTYYILQALKDNHFGKLYSIDLPFQWYIYGKKHKLHLDSLPAGKKPGFLVPKNLKTNWKLILGNTYEKLPNLLKVLNKIDIFIHDSEHTEKTMTFEYDLSWSYIKKGGLLISDDIDCSEAFEKFSNIMKVKPIILKVVGIIRKL